jgi:hypothetical protein
MMIFRIRAFVPGVVLPGPSSEFEADLAASWSNPQRQREIFFVGAASDDIA